MVGCTPMKGSVNEVLYIVYHNYISQRMYQLGPFHMVGIGNWLTTFYWNLFISLHYIPLFRLDLENGAFISVNLILCMTFRVGSVVKTHGNLYL